jgi:hypothetical protein
VAGIAEVPGRRDGDARPRRAGDQRQRLPEPHRPGVLQRPGLGGACLGAFLIGPPEHEAEDQHRPADHGGGAHQFVEPGQLHREAGDDDRHGGDAEAEREPGVLVLDLPAQHLRHTVQRARDIAAEVEDHGGQRADMHRDIDRQALILEPGKIGQQDQMARRGNRQELGEPLDDRDKKQVEDRHRQGIRESAGRA